MHLSLIEAGRRMRVPTNALRFSLCFIILPWSTHPVFLYIFSAEDGKLKTMAIYPGLTVQYSADGITWKDVTSDTTVKGRIKLRTRYVGLAKRSLKMPLVGGQGT